MHQSQRGLYFCMVLYIGTSIVENELHFFFNFQEEIIISVEIMREAINHAEMSLGALFDFHKGKRSSENVSKGRRPSGRGENSFQIRTLTDGFNSGRTYYLNSGSAKECKEVVGNLRTLVELARKRAENDSKFRESQKWLRAAYNSSIFQLCSSALIVLVPTKHTPYRLDHPDLESLGRNLR